MEGELCVCGSGRPFRACHGLRGRARRGRGRELHALGELHDLGLLFPFVRPRGAAIEALADRIAAEMGCEPRDTSPAEAAEAVRLLSDAERRRLVRSWAGRYPSRWRRVCAEVGDTALAESTLVASAVRGAVADRVGCPRGLVAELEDGALERSPGAALALVIAPQAVWSYEDVAHPDRAVVTGEHLDRLRGQARRLQRRLPFDGLPCASATLTEACELIADEEFAAAVAGLLLETYGVLVEVRGSYVSQRN